MACRPVKLNGRHGWNRDFTKLLADVCKDICSGELAYPRNPFKPPSSSEYVKLLPSLYVPGCKRSSRLLTNQSMNFCLLPRFSVPNLKVVWYVDSKIVHGDACASWVNQVSTHWTHEKHEEFWKKIYIRCQYKSILLITPFFTFYSFSNKKKKIGLVPLCTRSPTLDTAAPIRFLQVGGKAGWWVGPYFFHNLEKQIKGEVKKVFKWDHILTLLLWDVYDSPFESWRYFKRIEGQLPLNQLKMVLLVCMVRQDCCLKG